MATVPVGKVANILNLTPRRVQQLVKEGMPREATGQYDPVKCMLFYVRYLQQALEQQTIPTLEGYAGEREARLRILRTAADLKEIALSKQRSQLVAVPDVEAALAKLRRVATGHIMAIPSRLAPELVGETSRMMIQARIEKACKDAMRLLARSHQQ